MGAEEAKREPLRILIVDDVETNRFILRNIIKNMGYQPVLAENGVQALKIFPACKPTLVLLDVSMPEMGGFECCQIIKSNPETRDVPIIFISAFDDSEDVIKGFQIGGADYIVRPFIQEEVEARVGIQVKLYETTQKLSENNARLQSVINEQLRQMEHEKRHVLYALANVARENSCHDEGYMDRLRADCRTLGQAMQLSPAYEDAISDAYLDILDLSAPLCDIGNVAVPMTILKKESALTPEERKTLEQHTTVGARLLSDVGATGDYNDFIGMAVDIAHFHHENWDGSGYPTGKRGDEIPLAAQIVSLVSAYCALTEKRSYRDPFPVAQAMEILEGDVGVKFGPEVFRIFKKVIRRMK